MKSLTTAGGDAPDKKEKGKGHEPEVEEVPKTPSQIAREEVEYRAYLRKQRFKRKWPEITKVKIRTRPWHPPPPPQRMPRIVIDLPEIETRKWIPPFRRRRRQRPRLQRIPAEEMTQPLYEYAKLKKVVQQEPLIREPNYELDLKALKIHCKSEWDSININALIEKKIKEGQYPQCSLSAVSLATSRATSRKKVRDFYQKHPKEPAPQLPIAPEKPPPNPTQEQLMQLRGEDFFLYCAKADGHAYGRSHSWREAVQSGGWCSEN
ncbi:unnamed protein product [Leptidea sinapis]|uniref:Uncharacterized protein n=1 Tax=Leptidea sinapis TaxID=189913 RepID=A0A5E4QXS3_9NEOP|nr:unnamed protein product [Leptidea sinapis]